MVKCSTISEEVFNAKKNCVRELQTKEEYFMPIVFRAGYPNCPANQTELNKRLEEIEQLINKSDANIPFCEAAFKLIEDCDLITEDNVRFLCSAQACKKYDSDFWFIRNRKEGVLRPTKDLNNVFTGNYKRFYYGSDMYVEFYEQNFLIVNDWYEDFSKDRHGQIKPSLCPNKRAFYNWLKEKAQNACEKHWTKLKELEEKLKDFKESDWTKLDFEDFKESETIDPSNASDIFDKNNYIFDTENIESENVYKFRFSHSGIHIDNYFGSEEHVTIPAQIDGLPVTCIGYGAFLGCESLESITIPNSVTSIGEEAFSGCWSLKEITIPDSVTSIGESAFSHCESLESITIPDGVTKIGDEAFSCCKKLESIIIPDSVTSIGEGAFSGCWSLKEITIPDSVTSIGESAFSHCESLESIIIPDSVTSIDDEVFRYCKNLTEITIPDSVTSIGDYAFSGCDSLWHVFIPNGVKSIGDDAFNSCRSLTSIKISEGVTSIGYEAFYNCGLTEIEIPNSVKSIGNAAFFGCNRLKSIIIPDSVTSIGSGIFFGCEHLETVYINDSILSDDIRKHIRRQNPSCKILPIPKK